MSRTLRGHAARFVLFGCSTAALGASAPNPQSCSDGSVKKARGGQAFLQLDTAAANSGSPSCLEALDVLAEEGADKEQLSPLCSYLIADSPSVCDALWDALAGQPLSFENVPAACQALSRAPQVKNASPETWDALIALFLKRQSLRFRDGGSISLLEGTLEPKADQVKYLVRTAPEDQVATPVDEIVLEALRRADVNTTAMVGAARAALGEADKAQAKHEALDAAVKETLRNATGAAWRAANTSDYGWQVPPRSVDHRLPRAPDADGEHNTLPVWTTNSSDRSYSGAPSIWPVDGTAVAG